MANQNQSSGGHSGRGQGGQGQGGKSGNQSGNQGGGHGFENMDPDQQRETASEGGRAAHENGNAREFTSEDAREDRRGGDALGWF